MNHCIRLTLHGALTFLISFIPSAAYAQLISNPLYRKPDAVTASIYRTSFQDSVAVFPCSKEIGGCTDVGTRSAMISGEYDSPRQNVKASATIEAGTTPTYEFVHPHAHLSTHMTGVDGRVWTRAGAQVRSTGAYAFELNPRAILLAPTIGFLLNIQTIDIDVYDDGLLKTPDKIRGHDGGHLITYRRSVHLRQLYNVRNIGVAGTFARNVVSDSPEFVAQLGSATGQDLELPIENISSLSYSVATPFVLSMANNDIGVPEPDTLIAEYEFFSGLDINFIQSGRGGFPEAFGDISNTTGVSEIRVYNSEGIDISEFLNIYDAVTGAQLFTVPEPSSVAILAGGVIVLLSRGLNGMS